MKGISQNLKRIKKKMLSSVGILSLLSISTLSHAQPQVEVFIGSEVTEYTFAGRSSDKGYIAYLESLGDKREVIRIPLTSNGSSKSFMPETDHIKELALSTDGRYLVWSENVLDQDGFIDHMLLKRYDFETETVIELTPPDHSGDATGSFSVSQLKFGKGTGKLSYLLGYGTSNVAYEHVVVHDIDTGSSDSFEMMDLPVTNGWHVISNYDFSDDGGRLLLQLNVRYSAGDCCFTRSGYLVVIETEEQGILQSIDMNDKPLMYAVDLSGNGKYIAFQDSGKLKRVAVDDGSSVLIKNSVYNSANNSVDWMQLSYLGDVVAASGNGKLLDGSRFTNRQRFGYSYGSTITQEFRPNPILVVDIDSEKSEIVNKFSSNQLYRAQPYILEDDGSSVFFQIQQSELGLNRIQSYFVSHQMTYQFKADDALTGGWYDSQNPGHGVNIHMALRSEGEGTLPIVTWYTVDAEGQPFWLIMEGTFEGNSISGDAYFVSGSQFGEGYSAADTTTTRWGEMTIDFSSCQSAKLTYQPSIDGFEAGEIDLDRLFAQQGIGCL